MRFAEHMRQKTARSNEGFAEMLAKAAGPFVYAHHHHADELAAYPTAQAAYRFVASEVSPESMLPLLVDGFSRRFSDFELLERTDSMIFAGHLAAHVKSFFTVKNSDGLPFACVSRTYLVFRLPMVFSIGLSCAAFGEHHVPDELDQIAESIRIGSPGMPLG